MEEQGWRWRRRLFTWEEYQIEGCSLLLDNIFLQKNVSDKWVWKLDLIDGYSVKGDYNILTHFDHRATNVN